MPQALNDVIAHLSALPPFPKVAAKLLRLLDDTTVSVEELASVISSDPGLVMKVIHIANSPFYMCSRKVQNIRDAVLILGISTIKGVTTAVSVQQGLNNLQPQTDAFDQTGFWKHSYATAIMAARMASKQSPQKRDKAYLIGLIHDVGKLIQASYWPDSWGACCSMVSPDVTYEEAAIQVFGFSHHEVTVEVCTSWDFPQDIIQVLEELKASEEPSTGPLSDVLKDAHKMVNSLGFRYPVGAGGQTISPYQEDAENLSKDLAAEINYQLKTLEK